MARGVTSSARDCRSLIRRVDGAWGVLRARLPLDEVLDDLDESEVQERRGHEGEFENIQQAEEAVDA